MAGRLESDDLNERCDAFDYLRIQGKRGRNVIKDFCRRHTEHGWGEADVNLRLRIWTNVYCFQPKMITERTDLYNAFFYFEIQNMGNETVHICSFDSLRRDWRQHLVSHTKIFEFPFSNLTINDFNDISFEVLNGGETYRSSCCVKERLFFTDCDIYFLELTYEPRFGRPLGVPRNPQWPRVVSNRICFAVLPGERE
jgi:hypothetical protein